MRIGRFSRFEVIESDVDFFHCVAVDAGGRGFKEYKKKKCHVYGTFYFTGVERIELPLRVLETPVIPLDQTPM